MSSSYKILRRFFGADTLAQQKIKQKVSIHRAARSKRTFVDRIKVHVVAGTGGNGCVSHFHVAPGKKRPDGGHGGAGGHVYIRAEEGVKSLAKTTHHFKAGHGKHGLRKSIDFRFVRSFLRAAKINNSL